MYFIYKCLVYILFYMILSRNMKKFMLLWTLVTMVILAGCNSNNDVNLTSGDFEVESCNQYFKLVSCILDNDPNEAYTTEVRADLKNTLQNTKNEWLEKNVEELEWLCSSNLAVFEWMSEELAEIWCSLN